MRVTRMERLEALAPAADGRYRVLAFDVEATVEGALDERTGMVVNLTGLKSVLRHEVIEPLQGRCLDGQGGRPAIPTPEVLARETWSRLAGRFEGARLVRVRLIGNPSPIITCREGDDRMIEVTRLYEFSAAHRLHSESLSSEENLAIFGKCNNPNGHGHNYVLEVTVAGVLPRSGELLPADVFDRVVNERVVDRWDHRHLNEDVPEFSGTNPTAEQIARKAWDLLTGPLGDAGSGSVRLSRVKIRETPRNHVEYAGDDGDPGDPESRA